MDDPDDEAVNRFKRYEEALKWIAWSTGDEHIALLAGDTSMQSLRRTAFINACINFNRTILERINPSFPGIDLVDLAEKVRLQVVIDRLDGVEPKG